MTCWKVTPCLSSRAGSRRTWYCRSSPPQELISATPGTVRSAGRMTQSCAARNSSSDFPRPLTA